MKRRSNGNGRMQKIPTQNHKKKTTTIFGHINKGGGLEKQKISLFVVPKAEEDNAQNIDSLNNFVTRKVSHNDEFIRRIDNREDWKAMIADVCNRPSTLRRTR